MPERSNVGPHTSAREGSTKNAVVFPYGAPLRDGCVRPAASLAPLVWRPSPRTQRLAADRAKGRGERTMAVQQFRHAAPSVGFSCGDSHAAQVGASVTRAAHRALCAPSLPDLTARHLPGTLAVRPLRSRLLMALSFGLRLRAHGEFRQILRFCRRVNVKDSARSTLNSASSREKGHVCA